MSSDDEHANDGEDKPRRAGCVVPILVAIFAPVLTLVALRLLVPPFHGVAGFVLFTAVPLAVGATGILALPMTPQEKRIALPIYLIIMGALFSLQLPVLLIIACMFGNCI